MEPSVLVAEDDLELTELYENYLKRCGYRVLTAKDGVECLSIIRKDPPNVIMVSVDVPWGSVNGLVDCLREQSSKSQAASVILTGCTAEENVAALREEPCVFRYLRKPFLMGKLIDCIRAIESECDAEIRPISRNRSELVAAVYRQL